MFENLKTLDACYVACGLDREKVIEWLMPFPDRERRLCEEDANAIVQAINGAIQPDPANTEVPKYYIWWDIVDKPRADGSAGPALSLLAVLYDDSIATVGARRLFNSTAGARYAAATFHAVLERDYFGK